MDQAELFKIWAQRSDAVPLVLTGSSTARAAAVKALRGSFSAVDIHEVAPSGRTLKISDIRAMRTLAGQRAWSGRRLIIIPEAEKLSVPAAQALLKILEEPTSSTRFVLTTRWWRRLLPTIRSRCVQVRLSTADVQTASATTTTLPSSLVTRLAEFAGDGPLPDEILDHITHSLEQHLRQSGPTPELRTAYQRLRDYHRLVAEPGGNHKLARDVLLAALPPT